MNTYPNPGAGRTAVDLYADAAGPFARIASRWLLKAEQRTSASTS